MGHLCSGQSQAHSKVSKPGSREYRCRGREPVIDTLAPLITWWNMIRVMKCGFAKLRGSQLRLPAEMIDDYLYSFGIVWYGTN
eukprot:1731470-Pyramimonas_sp.AAC.1